MLARLQLPNPPPCFVGRTTEIRWLRDALARAPVTVIAGEGGLGKSALALAVLHGRFADRVDAALWLSLRDADPHEPVALGLLRALVQAGGLRDFDWAELLAAPEALAAVAVRLAEAQKRWILLEDAHHGEPGQVDALLGQAARYARESRLLVTTRRAPSDEALLGQVLPLGPMTPRDLTRLSRAIDPGAGRDAVREIVARAGGSPWRLRRAQSARPGAAPGETRAASELLEVLRLVPMSLPEATLARIVSVPPGDLEALDRRGLLEHRAEGVRLHEVAEDLVPAPSDGPRRRSLGARAATVLGTGGDAGAQLAALRLLCSAGALDAAAALLDTALTPLLDAGYAPALFRLLDGAADARFEHARLRCAVELADADALGRVGPPVALDPDTRLLWLRVLYARGELAETMRAAEDVRAAALAAGRADVAFHAGLWGARATANHAGVPQALALLDALEPVDAASAALRDGYRAYAFGVLCRGDEALAAAGAAAQHLAGLSWPARGQVGVLIARTHLRLARLREAAAILDAALAEGPHGSPRFDIGRGIRFTRAVLALDTGELARAATELDLVEPYLGPTTLVSSFVRQARVTLALAAGDLHAIDDRMAAADAAAPAVLRRESDVDRVRLALLRREPCHAPDEIPVVSIFGDAYRLYSLDHRLRAGQIAPDAALAQVGPFPEHAELRMLAHRVRAAALLVGGRVADALGEVSTAIALARERGYRVAEAECLELVSDIHIVEGASAPLAAAAAALAALAAAMPSARFACAARFLREIARGPVEPAALEAVAAAWGVAPPYALRARALLGAAVPLDAVDRLVLDALSRRPDVRAPEVLHGPPQSGPPEAWLPAWGIDERTSSVWLPDGTRVELARRPVSWRILDALLAGGGRAAKEELVEAVWQERAYHPLRHDNRLQVAVRALRALVEADPTRPARIVTTPEGYALGGTVRALRSAAATARNR